MIKWTVLATFLCLLVISSADNSLDDTELDEDTSEDAVATPRFAFVNLNSDGSISFTFNATSLQYTLLAALTALVLAAILLPLLGLIGIGSSEPDYGYAYTDQSGYTSAGYDVPPPAYGPPSSYGSSSYSKRYVHRCLILLLLIYYQTLFSLRSSDL